ncbi:S8 family peptidase [Candidatus Fukatsuia endosymbiont of Tuberolachnus salignus]|uniref:S8 family peptidase n=1 Tax=Candidatus Fukatsuia endosymbiont of Tuberolachnus salignus TaxID=3077957 RepID=UPI00313B7F07
MTGKGATVRHLDFGVYHAHEDLKGNITVINSRAGDCNHGTASTGCIAAIGNDYGVTGIAHNCHFFFYDTGDLNKIVRDVEPGDIISIDNQFKLGSYYVPMVHSKDYWNKFKLCVDAGAIVIYAGGNGGQNLKSLAPFNNWGSSGAIMIGACHSENGRKISASNYNHDKVINSWGMKVTTTGYGDLQRVEGSNRNYTSSYSGTSSATPLVAGALALIQSYAKTKYHVVFNAFDMHQIIEESGYKDAKGEDIGYRPNVIEALKRVDEKMIPFVPALPLWNKDKEYDNYGHEVSWANKNWANKNWVKGTEPGTERGQDDCPWVEIGSNEYIKEWWVVKKPLSQAKST